MNKPKDAVKMVKDMNAYIVAMDLPGWQVKSVLGAIELVNDVCEGEFDAVDQWDEAYSYFRTYFVSYALYMEEQDHD